MNLNEFGNIENKMHEIVIEDISSGSDSSTNKDKDNPFKISSKSEVKIKYT